MSDNVIFPDAANAFTKALQVRLLQEQISGEQEDREAGRQNSNALMQMLAQPSAAPSASPSAPTPTAAPQAATPPGAGKSFWSEVASVKARPPEQREAEYQRLVQLNTQNGRLKPGQAPPNWNDQWADQYLTGQPAPANLPVTAPTAAPRLPVQSTPKIVGDDEAVARGLYDPLPGRAAPGAAPPVAAQPVPQAAPAQASSPQDRFSAPNMQRWAIGVLASGGKVSDSQRMLADSIIKFGQQSNTIQTLADGSIVSINPRTNQVTPIYQSAKPTFGVIAKDSNGNDIHGWIDVTKQTAVPVNAQGANGPSGSTNAQLTGDAFLQTLDSGRASEIRAIADGRMAPPGGMSLKSPQIQGLMRDVAQYEPGFDMTTWAARNKTRSDLASGKMGQNVTSFNTALGHLDTLSTSADKLGNSSFPAYNAASNFMLSQTGDPRVAEFATAKNAVVDELTRAFRGTGGNVHDLMEWERNISAANSPQQLKAAVRQATELLRSRIEAVGEQYSRGMGKTTDALDLLSPKARTAIQRLTGEAPPGAKQFNERVPASNFPPPPPGFILQQ